MSQFLTRNSTIINVFFRSSPEQFSKIRWISAQATWQLVRELAAAFVDPLSEFEEEDNLWLVDGQDFGRGQREY